MELPDFGERRLYNFSCLGNFGKFISNGSFPVEYLQMTFSAADLCCLTFARDLQTEQFRFDLLMQREIDEERVRVEIEPYLNSQSGDIQVIPRYFPPLIVAIVPITQGNEIATYYSNETDDIVMDGDDIKYVIREWQYLFKLTYLVNSDANAYPMSVNTPFGNTTVGVRREPVQLEICLAHEKKYGVKLVVIDGQHRLYALRNLLEKNPALLEELYMPACILFAPDATEHQKVALGRVPTVPEVFRHLFVDINSTAKSVSGHFNILLSDSRLSSLICRQFCAEVLQQMGKKELAVLEWNVKTKQEANKISRGYSLTSIGVLDKALEDSFGRRQRLTNYLLQLDKVAVALAPVTEDEDEDEEMPVTSPNIQWRQVALSHKDVLEAQVRKHLVPCLKRIFFGSQGFAKMFEVFDSHLRELQKIAASDAQEVFEARQVLSQILDYIPISEGIRFEKARFVYHSFEVAVKRDKDKHVLMLFQYALFQRALIEVWAQVLDLARLEVPEPLRVTEGFIKLLDIAFQEQGEFFSFEQIYLQYTVFVGNKFITREETRRVLVQLLLAHLDFPYYTQQVINEMQLAEAEAKKLMLKFQKKGKSAVVSVSRTIEMATKKYFKMNYRTNASLTSTERDELFQADEEQQRQQQEMREGKRSKTEVSERFEILVNQHVRGEIGIACQAFQNTLYGQKELSF